MLFWRRKGGTSSPATLGQSQSADTPPNFNYSSLDPLTGVPYSVESQINPNTGLPNYYNQPPAPAPLPAPVVPTGPSGGVKVPPSTGPYTTNGPFTNLPPSGPPPYQTPAVGWPTTPGYVKP